MNIDNIDPFDGGEAEESVLVFSHNLTMETPEGPTEAKVIGFKAGIVATTNMPYEPVTQLEFIVGSDQKITTEGIVIPVKIENGMNYKVTVSMRQSADRQRYIVQIQKDMRPVEKMEMVALSVVECQVGQMALAGVIRQLKGG
ncbi:MAG: hypothetical protein Q9M91_04750 [Candidatus Dojkabacteria bacterium]|nr:hypothetical protein [Candidatus Dojkabacteria bacterium]MDQ7021119.1 hypothetical protein [Candidatus Dojkabacteria bacterium]